MLLYFLNSENYLSVRFKNTLIIISFFLQILEKISMYFSFNQSL